MDRKQNDWSSRGHRRPVNTTAEAQWADGSSASVVVSNMSYEGCQLTSRHQFARGETVKLQLPERGEIFAHIRWVRNGKAGARFLTGDSALDVRRARIGV